MRYHRGAFLLTSIRQYVASDRDWATDLFWTFTKSPYNTIFKLFFIGTSAYTVHLMLNEYKPTQDPNLDTFKVEYLLGGSALMAILFPVSYTPWEVRR